MFDRPCAKPFVQAGIQRVQVLGADRLNGLSADVRSDVQARKLKIAFRRFRADIVGCPVALP